MDRFYDRWRAGRIRSYSRYKNGVARREEEGQHLPFWPGSRGIFRKVLRIKIAMGGRFEVERHAVQIWWRGERYLTVKHWGVKELELES